jgi:hypothetical protein
MSCSAAADVVYLACNPLGRIGAFRQLWRFEESITYLWNFNVAFGSNPTVPTIHLPDGWTLTKNGRGAKIVMLHRTALFLHTAIALA